MVLIDQQTRQKLAAALERADQAIERILVEINRVQRARDRRAT